MRGTVHVDAEVEVDEVLSEADHEDIIKEIKRRLDNKYYPQNVNKQFRVEIARILGGEKPGFPKNISMVDQSKIDFLLDNLDKIKLEDLEKLIIP